MFLTKIDFQYVSPFTLNHFFDINNLLLFIYVHNTNKQITTNYDTQANKKPSVIFIVNPVENVDGSVPIHQILIPKEIESLKQKVSDMLNE